jgi:hypothetical protein
MIFTTAKVANLEQCTYETSKYRVILNWHQFNEVYCFKHLHIYYKKFGEELIAYFP